MASFVVSYRPLLSPAPFLSSPSPSIRCVTQFKVLHQLFLPFSFFSLHWLLNLAILLNKGWGGRGVLMLPLKCISKQTPDSETSSPSSSSSSSSISAYNWCAGLGGLGFLETTYLTYVKLTNSDAFCPIGGGTCGDVLNSDYAAVFGTHFFF